VVAGLAAAACAAPEAEVATPATAPSAALAQPADAAQRAASQAKLAAEARALLAQAETDVQRARAKRALWLGAWEDLLAARQAVAGNDYAQAIVRAREASELSELGLGQLAYPAVK
jgi:predicted esterase YcpF (UPF0227 family)